MTNTTTSTGVSSVTEGALRFASTNGPLGVDVFNINLADSISDAAFAEILDAWCDHLVLRIRGQQGLTPAELVAFSRMFGELDMAPITIYTGKPFIPESPEIAVISNIVEDGKPIGGLANYEAEWHTDMSYKPNPPSASVLFSVEVPPTGGDTSFSNMYMAYETLPRDLAQRIEGLTCRHDSSRNSAGQLRKGANEVTDPRETPGAVHGLVRTHPLTKRKALFLGRRRNAYILGLELAESEALLEQLWAHATRPEFTWTQKWQLGDVIIWDNRCTMHQRDALDPACRRLMYRTQIKEVEVQ